MTASLRALLEGIIDYAGLFPPAQLPLEEAFANYLRYRGEAESWMLGRFVIPVTRLMELNRFVVVSGSNGHGNGAPIRLSVLGRVGNDSKTFMEYFHEDAGTIAGFVRGHRSHIDADVVEMRLTESFGFGDGDLGVLTDVVGRGHGFPLTAFFETASSNEPGPMVTEVASACSGKSTGIRPSGVKLRCGGLDAAAFPPPDQIAYVITVCRDALVPLKFTAGLHHPIRHYDDSVKTKMHGFLNVFGAGVLAHRHRLSEEQVREIIEDEDPTHFVFDDEGFRWKDWRAAVGEIRLARQVAVTSFGSCSFDEPREDLRKLGLL